MSHASAIATVVYSPYTLYTGDITDPASLVTLHLYCPVFVVLYDVLLLLSTLIHLLETFFSQ